MSETANAVVLLIVLLASSAVGLFTRPLLAERLRDREALEVVQLVITMLVTFAALVLSLLTTSAKTSFDVTGNDLRGFSTELIQLNRLLVEYGADGQPIRQMLRSYTAASIASTWRNEPAPPGNYYPKGLPRLGSDAQLESSSLGERLGRVELRIRELQPGDGLHRRLAADLLDQFERLATLRWKLIEEAHSSISTPFLLILDFWLVIVFLSFGLTGPRNAVSGTIIVLGAISIASAMFVILELDGAFTGLLTVSSQPMRDALAHLSS
ncbi:MAG: hypothetical protein ACREF3_12020 [Acetobacteraceae bacterium]